MIVSWRVIPSVVLPVVFCALVLPLAEPVSAVEVRTRDVTISESEYVDDDLFLFGDDVKMEGTVTGDLVATGDSIDVTGSVGGDVYLAGGEVLVTGDIAKSLYIAGGRVKLSGVVQRNVYLAGGQLLISSDAYVMEDVIAMGGQIDLDGWVGDDLWASGGNLNIRSSVEDDLIASGGMVRSDEKNVGGDYRVKSGQSGVDWNWIGRTTEDAQKAAQRSILADVVSRVLLFVGMLLVGVVLIRFAPVKTNDVISKLSYSTGEFLWSLGVGLLVTAALPIVIILLAITVVGIPAAVLLIGVGVFLVLFGSLWMDMAIGQKLLDIFEVQRKNLYSALLIGRILRFLITLVPCVGALYSLVTFWAVCGAAIRMKVEKVDAARSAGKMTRTVNEGVVLKSVPTRSTRRKK